MEKALKPLWFQGFLAHVAFLTCRFGAFAEAAGKRYQGQINYKTAQNALFKAQQENKSAEEIKQLQETTDLAKKECDVAGGEVLLFDSLNLKNPEALEDALNPKNLFAEKSPFRTAAQPEQAPAAAVNQEKIEEKKQPEAALNV